MRARSGVSLLEAVIALMVFTGATLSVVAAFHHSLRQQAQADDRALALSLAQQKLESLRFEASTIEGFEAMATGDSAYQPIPDHPGLEMAVRVRDAALLSPCSAFNKLSDMPRGMDGAAHQVTVFVRWARNAGMVRLTTVISEPPHPLDDPPRLQVVATAPIPPELARDDELPIQAQLLDRRGNPIRGVKFHFWIKPRTANATLRRLRNGKEAKLINKVSPPTQNNTVNTFGDGPAGPSYSGGETVVTARARYFGQDVDGRSPRIPLQP